MVADGSCAVLSFDVFDTVLWRRVPRPTDLFAVLAARLRETGRCPTWITDAAFRRLRIIAEQEARHHRGSLGSEVSLFDIWSSMPLATFHGATLDELVEAEVEAERDFTVVDLDVAEIIALARKNNVPIVFVSDTYFTEGQLAYLLDRPELGSLASARIYRSHQHGVDKASGLWEIVLSDLGCRPEQIVHVGDNPVADGEVPAKLGIRTVAYERIDHDFAAVLERERESLDWLGPHSTHLDPSGATTV